MSTKKCLNYFTLPASKQVSVRVCVCVAEDKTVDLLTSFSVVYLIFLQISVCGCTQSNNRSHTRECNLYLLYSTLTEPFSMTLLSMMTALVFCSQIMSQK